MQVQRTSPFGRTGVGLIAAVYNVLNRENATAVSGNAGTRV